MANTTKTTTDEVIETTMSVQASSEKAKTSAKKETKKFGPTDLIECKSVTAGELILIGRKSQLQYTWADYGDTTFVEYQDLQALQSMRSGFLIKPRFVIENADLVSQWSAMLKPIYDAISDQSIEELFTLEPGKFEYALTRMSVGVKEAIKTKAAAMIQSRELYDLRIIEIIDKILGTELKEVLIG